MTSIRQHILPLAIIFVVLAFFVVLKISWVGLTPSSDYYSYVATAQVFSGGSAAEHPERILKPLAPLFVTVLAPVFGYMNAFIVEVVVFYIALALALYALGWVFFKNRWHAFIFALLIVASYPITRYAVDLYTETGALFFYTLSMVGMLAYLLRPNTKTLALTAASIGIGLLWKEYSLVSGLAFGLILLFENTSVRTKITNLVVLGVISLLPTLLVQAYVYSTFHYTYLTWYKTGGASGFATQFTAKNLTKSIAALLGLAWLFVPSGYYALKKMLPAHRRFILMCFIASLVVFGWGFVSSRLFFVIAIPLTLVATAGLVSFSKKYTWAAVAIILLTDLAWLLVASHTVHL